MKTQTTILFVTILSVLALPAIAGSKNSCPVPGGVKCMSPSDVYNATNSLDSLEFIKTPKQEKALRQQIASGGIVIESDGLLLQSVAQNTATKPKSRSFFASKTPPTTIYVEPNPVLQQAPPPPSSTEPYRVPAQVMRIWMAPWEDAAGDLHMPSYLFTEVKSRRWSVADPAPVISPELRLITPNTSTEENNSADTAAN